jgi:hypothetical protein
MRGLDYVEALRRKRLQPALVILDVIAYEADVTPNWLQIEARDVPELLDLRVLVGLTVAVSLPTNDECERWVRAVMAAGAETVLVSPHVGEPGIRRLGGVDQ